MIGSVAAYASAGRPRFAGLPPRQIVAWLRIAAYLVILAAVAVWTIDRVVGEITQLDRIVVATLVLGGTICALGLTTACARHGISLATMFWFFNFFFLSLAPLVQYLSGVWQFPMTRSSMIAANLLLLGYYAAFAVGYGAGSPAGATLPKRLRFMRLRRRRLVLLSVAALVVVGALAVKTGFVLHYSMWLVAVAAEGELAATSATATLPDFVVRTFVFFLFLFALFSIRLKPRIRAGNVMLVLIAATAALLFNAPTSAARFYVFTLYFGLMIVLFRPSPRRSAVYLAVLVGGLFASSFANVVRQAVALVWYKGVQDLNVAESWSLRNLFFSGHFDAYENFVHGWEYIRSEGIVWGHQLLGPLLFWVPRTSWPGKPVGTGGFIATEFLARKSAVGSTNVSAPLVEEALVNFGIPGVFLFGLMLGCAFGWLDARYRAYRRLESAGAIQIHAMPRRAPLFLLFYPVVVAYTLFYQRGDALSGTAYGVAILSAFLIADWLLMGRIPRRRATSLYDSQAVGT